RMAILSNQYLESQQMKMVPLLNNTVAKLPLLKQENGNSFKPVPQITANENGTSTLTILGPVTTKEKARKKNDVKARSMLLMALPNEHLLTFSQYKDAKTLYEAIQAIFSGNDASKKTQRTLLNLPAEWNTHVVVWRNKADLDTMSIDDLYNNFKIVEQEVKKNLSAVSTLVSIVSSSDNTANLSDATVYFQKTGKKVTINGSDTAGPRNQDSSRKTVIVEDTSSKAMVAIDGVGFDWSYIADDEVPTNMVLMAFSDSKLHNSKTCSNTCLKSFETLKTQYDNLRIEFNKSEFDLATYKRGYGPKDSKSVCIDTSNEIKKALDAPLIEDWVSDSDEDEYKEMVLKFDNVQHKPEQANQPRIGTGQRVVEPVLNNAMRTNHHNFSSSRRSFAPTAVLTKSAIVQISTARQSSSRAAAPVSVARPINTATSKPLVNVAKPRSNDFQKSHSLSRRHSYQQTTPKNTNLNNNVNATKENSVNTAKGNKVTSAIGKQGINAVKSSACWGAPQNALKDQGYFDSGCSRHMIGNISYLADVKEHWD
nr:hypothetical protein [Tanacetum cinerariifolium]